MVSDALAALSPDASEEPLCIAFVNTVGSRRSRKPNEYLPRSEDLKAWLVKRRLASEATQVDESYRVRALDLRDAIYRIFSRIASGETPKEADLEALNAELCEALAKLELDLDLQWALRETDESERALMTLALSASSLLTSELRGRVRECADEECGWLFVDRSKNRSRRWCSMSDCGNLAKARRYQERHRGLGSP